MSKLAALAVILAIAGCALEDAPGKDLCVTEANCLSGHRCVEGHCVSGVAPDAGVDAPDQDAPVLLDGVAPESQAAADLALAPDVAAGEDAPVDTAPIDLAPDSTVDDLAPDSTASDLGLDSPVDVPTRCGDGVREGLEACDRGEAGDEFCDGQCRWKRPPRLSAGEYHTCLRTGDDRIACWGDNLRSEVTPHPPKLRRAVAGQHVSCGLRLDGSIDCWGVQYSGSNASTIPSGPFQDLALAGDAACGVRDNGTLACWDRPFPSDAAAPAGKFVALAISPTHGCARAADGTVACWGRNDSGELDAPADKFMALSVQTARSCGVTVEGRIRCWGSIELDRKGPYTTVSVGAKQVCGVSTAGAVTCWGFAGAELPAPAGVFTDVSAGAEHVCALRIDGGVTCWGNNDYWQVGPPRGPFLDVSVAGQGGCAVTTAHDVTCWGNVGDKAPTGLIAPPAGKFNRVSVAGYYVCGIRQGDGGMSCWGDLPAGMSAPPGSFESVAVPCAIRTDGTVACLSDTSRAPPDRFSQLASDGFSMCGLRVDGKILCWLMTTGFLLPVPPSEKFVAVATSSGIVCGLRGDGTVSCTGCQRNPMTSVWECGAPVPAAWLPSAPLEKIGANGPWPYFCGLGRDGRMHCWVPSGETDGLHPSNDGREAVDFWSGCALNAHDALLCQGNHVSVDLDRPTDEGGAR